MEKPSAHNLTVTLEKPREKTLGSKIKKAVKNWTLVSSADGVPNLFRAERTSLRVLWIISLVFSGVACFYLMVQGLFAYLEYNVSNQMTIVYHTPAEFPTVAICNQNLFVTNESFAFVQNISQTNYISDLTSFISLPYNDFSDVNSKKFNMLYARYIMQLNAKNPDLNDSFRKSLGLSYNDFVLSCYFGSGMCDENDFVWYYDILLGNCFKFNSGYYQNGTANQLKTITKPGPMNGLQLTLYTAIPDDMRSLAFSTGAHVIIYNSTGKPENYDGVEVAPGTNTNVAVNRQFINQLPYPYNECYDDVDSAPYNLTLYKRIKSFNLAYKRTTCFDLCYQNILIQSCKCYDMNYLTLDSITQPCLTFEQINCNLVAWTNFQSQDVTVVCGSLCPLECDSVAYTMSVSFSKFPSAIFSSQLSKLPSIQQKFPNQNITQDLLESSLLQLNIYYEENSYTTIEEQPSMTILDLIANFGGTLGLFLGISFLSFGEMFEILAEIVFISYEHFREKRSRRVSHDTPKSAE